MKIWDVDDKGNEFERKMTFKENVNLLRGEILFRIYEHFMNWYTKHHGGSYYSRITTKDKKKVELYVDWKGEKY